MYLLLLLHVKNNIFQCQALQRVFNTRHKDFLRHDYLILNRSRDAVN
jgi:hypothetical protein